MAKKTKVARPQEELLGQSTPYHWKRMLMIYAVFALLVVSSAILFTASGVMDQLQILLTVLVLLCVAGGAGKAIKDAKTQVLLYDTWFQVGENTYGYGEIYQLERHREQVTFRTGGGMRERHSFFAGNANALHYIIDKKSNEARRAAKVRKKVK